MTTFLLNNLIQKLLQKLYYYKNNFIKIILFSKKSFSGGKTIIFPNLIDLVNYL